MKLKFLALLLFLAVNTISAQLVINPGAQFSIAGNLQLTLQNSDLVNNGIFIAGNSLTRFTGSASSAISGSEPIQFFGVEMNKSNNTSVFLQRAINVKQRILFTSGLLDLNGFNTDLGTTGFLQGENENSRITGTNGGQVLFSTVLNAPVGDNPANLGAVISSSRNLGQVIIKRGHQSQVNVSGLGNSVLRYFDIIPENNSSLDATLRFSYFDGELNGFNENSLVLFKSENAVNWSLQGFSTTDANANFVEKTGIGTFSRWTLSSINDPLPVRFILFNTKCEDNKVLITWKTAQEQNSSYFNIERSVDGITWSIIGNLPAAGNSNNETSYTFTDGNPGQKAFYRIGEYDLDGRSQYTSILRSSCIATDVFSLWPNPVRGQVFINIVTDNESQAMVKVFDGRGALIKVQKVNILRGRNQFSVDTRTLANGIYSLSIEWDNGQMKKLVQVLKQ